MYNYFMIIGKVTKVDTDGIYLDVIRPFRNQYGEYESDIVPIKLFEYLLDMAQETVNENNNVAVKGRIVVNDNNEVVLVGEKLVIIK